MVSSRYSGLSVWSCQVTGTWLIKYSKNTQANLSDDHNSLYLNSSSSSTSRGFVTVNIKNIMLESDYWMICVLYFCFCWNCLCFSYNTLVWSLQGKLPAVHACLWPWVPESLPGLYPFCLTLCTCLISVLSYFSSSNIIHQLDYILISHVCVTSMARGCNLIYS